MDSTRGVCCVKRLEPNNSAGFNLSSVWLRVHKRSQFAVCRVSSSKVTFCLTIRSGHIPVLMEAQPQAGSHPPARIVSIQDGIMGL